MASKVGELEALEKAMQKIEKLEIYKEISLIYDAEIKQIQEDVDCFVNQLLELNLIKTYK